MKKLHTVLLLRGCRGAGVTDEAATQGATINQEDETLVRKESERAGERKKGKGKGKKKHGRRKQLQPKEKAHGESMKGARIEMAREDVEAEEEEESIEMAREEVGAEVDEESIEMAREDVEAEEEESIEMAREEVGAEVDEESIEMAKEEESIGKNAQGLDRQPIKIEMGPHCHILAESLDYTIGRKFATSPWLSLSS